jgi:hypothetical protein
MKSWRGYPSGDPETDPRRLDDWLRDDLAAAGLRAAGRFTYAPYEGEQGPRGIGDLARALLGESQVDQAHVYHARIDGVGRPMELDVTTTAKGEISSLLYIMGTDVSFGDEIRFVKQRYVRSGKFDGPRAKELNGNKDAVKRLRNALSASHDPLRRSWFGLRTRGGGVSGTTMFLDPAYLVARNDPEGSTIVAWTQVFAPIDLSMLTLGYIPIYKGEWRLGVAQILDGARGLESLA